LCSKFLSGFPFHFFLCLYFLRPLFESQAVRAVREGDLEIIPSKFIPTWYYWMENIQPWCISRQLWWGHRIPAYLVYKKGEPRPTGDRDSEWIVARTMEDVEKEALRRFPGSSLEDLVFHQDEDVLDTWFSSALFPFSVFGWPNPTADLSHFYPIELMETGHDILFFWVARMVMMGWKLTGTLPFKQVFLHAIVRDAHGRKMSKTLGNVIDPIDVIEGITLDDLHETLKSGNLDPTEVKKAIEGQKRDFPNGISECGTDALRLTLCTYTSQGANINLNVNQIIADRNFCNKLWNVVKFAMKFFPADYAAPPVDYVLSGPHRKEVGNSIHILICSFLISFFFIVLQDEWILSRLNDACGKAILGFKEFQLGNSTLSLKDFILKELCDVYLEAMKPVMYNESSDPDISLRRKAALDTLYTCLDHVFRMLHPFMPFVTEELWQRLPRRPTDLSSIMISPFPSPQPAWSNPAVEVTQQILSSHHSLLFISDLAISFFFFFFS
jgi:valyl-tRNA synthetase